VLKDEYPANTFLMRGASKYPELPTMQELFGVRAAAIATYPTYRGLAKLVGMALLQTGEKIADEFVTLEAHWKEYDFFYIHIKKTDSYGEDGNFEAKKHIIEEVDTHLPLIMKLNPSVLLVTGDHCTPTKLKAHSWHPSPVLLWAPLTCLPDKVGQFGERACLRGGLGHMNHLDLMPLMLAHALRLHKYGA
jgi:2,3-bisphosphoglycerate-independent phosphoglycerate mutase